MEKSEMQSRVREAMGNISAALGLFTVAEDVQAMELIGEALGLLAPVRDAREVEGKKDE